MNNKYEICTRLIKIVVINVSFLRYAQDIKVSILIS
ncbi:MAG: hypothetical protein KatS3mg083_380 [Candidatus Dojkabacteria bacterium]|nr:MAG: hypothetical protein KatS3mg083_380 [Candidatus Dojkabacteria bacterium]